MNYQTSYEREDPRAYGISREQEKTGENDNVF